MADMGTPAVAASVGLGSAQAALDACNALAAATRQRVNVASAAVDAAKATLTYAVGDLATAKLQLIAADAAVEAAKAAVDPKNNHRIWYILGGVAVVVIALVAAAARFL